MAASDKIEKRSKRKVEQEDTKKSSKKSKKSMKNGTASDTAAASAFTLLAGDKSLDANLSSLFAVKVSVL